MCVLYFGWPNQPSSGTMDLSPAQAQANQWPLQPISFPGHKARERYWERDYIATEPNSQLSNFKPYF